MSQNTTRTVVCDIALKAGAAATTGTQTAPAPDAGFVGLYAITVSNGQSTITSANILRSPITTAPFFPNLPAVPGDVQNQTWIGYTDTSLVANSVVITPYPPTTSYIPYEKWCVKVAHNNTAAATLNVNGLGAVAIQLPSGAALSGGELKAGSMAELVFDGSVFGFDVDLRKYWRGLGPAYRLLHFLLVFITLLVLHQLIQKQRLGQLVRLSPPLVRVVRLMPGPTFRCHFLAHQMARTE